MAKQALSLTIVIPVYNEESHLRPCLQAIAVQTDPPDAVIVVDNNSIDGSMQIVRDFPFVQVLHEKRQGVAYARDTGFDAVTTDLIGRIDADTRLPRTWVRTVKAQFAAQPEMAAVSGPTGFYDLPFPAFTLWLTKVVRTALFYVGRSSNKYLFASNLAMRTSAWQAVAKEVCHVRGLHEDNDLAIHLEDAGLHVCYSNQITAMISVRRADTPLRQAPQYAFGEFNTFRHHHIFSIHAWLAGAFLIFIHPGLKIAHRAYDPAKKRYTIANLLHNRPTPRPHPMA